MSAAWDRIRCCCNVLFESRTPHTLLALAEAGHVGVAIVPSVLPTRRYDLQIVRLTYQGKRLREGYAILRDKRRSLPPAAEDFCQSLVAYVREVFPISRPSEGKTGAAVKRVTAERNVAKSQNAKNSH
jgi:DNA-binding transcriptional LysR family regulator